MTRRQIVKHLEGVAAYHEREAEKTSRLVSLEGVALCAHHKNWAAAMRYAARQIPFGVKPEETR